MSEALDVQLKKDAREFCALALLSHGERYAYGIARQLAEEIGIGEGTIYPLMRTLRTEGLVDS